MSINLKIPDIRELKPRITVFGTGGAGGNAVNNMISSGLQGVDFVVANTDAQALTMSKAERIIQMGVAVTEGLGAGSQPEVGRAAAEEVIDEIRDHLQGAHMVFVTAGMGGGTGTGAAPVVARCAKEAGILTVGVVTKPFHFEGVRRMRVAENGISELHKVVDTLLIIPNQNLFRVANEKTTFADAFAMADQVLYSGVACITDLMVKEGLINLDFADVRAVMREMGKAMMGTGEASGEKRALSAAEAAISNPLIDDASMKGAKGLLISITGGKDLTLYEVDEAATRIREEVDQDANIIVGATFDETLEGIIRVSVVATGIDQAALQQRPATAPEARIAELTQKLRADQIRAEQQRVATERVERNEPRQRGRNVGFRQPHVDAVLQPQVPAPFAHQDRGAHEGAQRGVAVEQRQEFLRARLRAAPDHERQFDEARRDIGSEHGAVFGNDVHLSVLLPQREGLALLDADLKLAGIEFEHGGVGDPGIGLEAFARLLDVEKEQRRGVGDAGGGEHLLAADVVLAGKRDRHDPEAGGIGGAVTRVFQRRNDARDMIAFDGAVGEARENDDDGAGNADAAGPARVDQRRPPVHELREARPRSHALRPLPATARIAA